MSQLTKFKIKPLNLNNNVKELHYNLINNQDNCAKSQCVEFAQNLACAYIRGMSIFLKNFDLNGTEIKVITVQAYPESISGLKVTVVNSELFILVTLGNNMDLFRYDQNLNSLTKKNWTNNQLSNSEDPRICYTSNTFLFLLVDNGNLKAIFTNNLFEEKSIILKVNSMSQIIFNPKCLTIGDSFYIFWDQLNGLTTDVYQIVYNESATITKNEFRLLTGSLISGASNSGVQNIDPTKFLIYYKSVKYY